MTPTARVVIAACLWGTTGTAFALAPESTGSLSAGALRLLVGGATLAMIGGIRPALMRRPAVMIAALGMAAYQPFFFEGVDRTGIAVGTAIAIGSAPFLTGAFSFVRGERPTRAWASATALAVVGLTIMLVIAASDPTLDGIGAVMCLGAGASYALYATATRALAGQVETTTAAAATFVLAALLLLPVLVTQDIGWLGSVRGVTAALWLGVGATAVAYILYTAGLRYLTAPHAATLSLAEPLTAALLGVVFLAERPPPLAWLGAAIVAVALVWAARAQPSYRGGTNPGS